jgi:predicted SAM-dependent methyltransferase
MKRLEIGCGASPTPGFLHQDVTRQEGVYLDYQCNPYEIEDEGFDLILAAAVMEHLRFVEFERTLAHFLKILNVGGQVLFDVPDLKVWCRYYIDSCEGKPVPFEHHHILSTLYGWQRWEGDEHKSGWNDTELCRVIESLSYKTGEKTVYFSVEFGTPEIFKALGISRRRFDRPADAHIYVRLTKMIK